MNNIVMESPAYIMRCLQINDADRLSAFYNRLSKESKRTFRPIGPITIPEKCAEIAVENIYNGTSRPAKYDLIALYDDELIGWSFLWDLDKSIPTFGLRTA